jgi:hypothetical protein
LFELFNGNSYFNKQPFKRYTARLLKSELELIDIAGVNPIEELLIGD